MTAFLPEGDTIYLSGSINEDTAVGFSAVHDANPKANLLVTLEANGPAGSAATMGFGRAVWEARFSTQLCKESVISGRAVDAFLGGTQRSMEEDVMIAVARGADIEAHKGFAKEMTGGDGYARFAD